MNMQNDNKELSPQLSYRAMNVYDPKISVLSNWDYNIGSGPDKLNLRCSEALAQVRTNKADT